MKKRFLALLLTLVMCTMLLPTTVTPAAETKTTTSEEAVNSQPVFSAWSTNDLIVGDTYGIYPKNWYNDSMTKAITKTKLRSLFSGLRYKIISTNEAVEAREQKPKLKSNMSVEEVLNAFYTIISNYDYNKRVGLEKKYTPTAFMKEYGIYTGKNGEQSLKDTCSIEQACVIATRLVTYLYDALDAASKGFMWVTKSGDNTVYLLGSIHMASYDIYPFSQTMLKAFESSDALAVELNMLDTKGAVKIAQLGVYTDGTTLKDHVSEETYKQTIDMASKFGYSEAQISMLKPWYIYTLFSAYTNTDSGSSEEVGTAAALGIDMKFTIDATITGKQILEVEGYEYQGKVLDSFSDELEEYLLLSTIYSMNTVLNGTNTAGNDLLDMMLEYWHDGDVEAFLKTYNSDNEDIDELQISDVEKRLLKEYQYKLMTQRDQGMADYIDKLLKSEGSNTYFVVVGSAHYVSDYSVLDILKEKGYTLEQVK